jgi:hypothetical protein
MGCAHLNRNKTLKSTKDWTHNICVYLSRCTKPKSELQTDHYYAFYSDKQLITHITKITKIVRNIDDFPIEGLEKNGQKIWYKDKWLIPCHSKGYQLLSTLDEAETFGITYIDDVQLEQAQTNHIYKHLIKKYSLSPKAIENSFQLEPTQTF